MLDYLIPNRLAKRLASNSVPEWLQVSILIVCLLFQGSLGRPSILKGEVNSAGMIYLIIQLGIAVLSVVVAYNVNEFNSGSNIIQRYFTLGMVLFLWVNLSGYILYLFLYFLLLGFLQTDATLNIFRPYGPAQYCYLFATSLAYLILIYIYFKRIIRFENEKL